VIAGLDAQWNAVRNVLSDATRAEVAALRMEAGAGLTSLAMGIVTMRLRRVEERARLLTHEMTLDEYHEQTEEMWREDEERAA